jgi:hypothetical protein
MTPKIPHDVANEGDLSGHGYHLSVTSKRRRMRALDKAVHELGVHKVLHELEALAIRMRNPRDPKVYAERAWSDYRSLERKHGIPRRR